MKKIFCIIILLVFSSGVFAQNASEIRLKLEKLKTVGAVLYLAAHPDDENTRLLAYLANEMKVRTAYLSLTRGDGGQNLIGTEQSEKLGMIRTQELLAARLTDGAEQYFTRAFDFGFSKGPDETLSIWNKDSVLADMVWVIRNFQPDIIITRFPTDGSGGHGHHTSSAILAEIAMDEAADPTKYPEQLKYVKPWKVKRIVWNGFNFGGRPQSDGKDFTKLDVGSFNPLLGKSYGEIASTSRSQHKSQGFGVPMQRGTTIETFKFVKGDSVKQNIFDGIDFTWNRFEDAKKIDKKIDEIIKKYDATNPSASIPALIELEKQLKLLKNDYWRKQKSEEIQSLIMACAGLYVEANAGTYITSINQNFKITFQAINRSSASIKLSRIEIADVFDTVSNTDLLNNKLFSYSTNIRLPSSFNYSNPYWLKTSPSKGIFHVNDQLLIGKAFNDFEVPVKFRFQIYGMEYTIIRNVVYKWTDPVKGELYRNLEVVPAVDLSFDIKNLIFTNSTSTRKVTVNLHTNEPSVKGDLRLQLPSGWSCNPQVIPFQASTVNANLKFEFEISTTTSSPNTGKIIPIAIINNKNYSSSIERIQYDHIPTQIQVREESLLVEKIDVIAKGKKAGYIPGAGDEIPEALKNLGFEVVELTDDVLASRSLDDLDVIVAGIRLYNTNDKMQLYYDKLMNYVKSGGNYVVQYNTSNFISSVSSKIGPYPFQISRDRVTDENAMITFIDVNNSILNYPNKITQNDFDNWVQERGLYFVNNVDANYTKIFTCADPNEKQNEGMLITCKYGKGVFTYTGAAFFRQLPAGVPGAYRLFANIVSQAK